VPVERYLDMPLLWPRTEPGVQRPGQWVGTREKRWIIILPHAYLLVVFKPYKGVIPVALTSTLTNNVEEMSFFPDLRSMAMKKLSIGGEGGEGVVPLSGDSKIFAKFPRLCEFWTRLTYDDGSRRLPGRHWFDQDSVGFTLTLFEVSGMAKMRCRAATIDDCYALAEKCLGSDNAPWEVDAYAREKAAGKKPKK